MKIRNIIFPYLFLCLLVLFCSEYDATDSSRQVHNTTQLWGDESEVGLELIKKIGDDESKGDNYLFYNPFDMTKDSEGNLYILDSRNCRIQVFDKDGEFIRTIGREGQGPGEILESVCIDIEPASNIYVNDPLNGRIQIFNSDGTTGSKHLDETINRFTILNSGNIVYSPPQDHVLTILNLNDNSKKHTGKPIELDNELYQHKVNNLFLTSDIKDNIYITYERLNRIEKYNPEGDLIFRADRPLNYELEKHITEESIPGSDINAQTAYMTWISTGIAVDHMERIWILTFNKQPKDFIYDSNDLYYDHFIIEIFNSEGQLLGTLKDKLPISLYYPGFKIFGDHLYLIDSAKLMTVYEYRIIEK
ncbi:MAG: 6-bladed beta-propeller [bacterium]|nr:6-bladed beta-propeller [bacterium]